LLSPYFSLNSSRICLMVSLFFVSLRRRPPEAVFPEGSISPSLKGSVAS